MGGKGRKTASRTRVPRLPRNPFQVFAPRPGICQGVKDIGATNYPDATTLWDQTGNFIGTALPRMERGKAFSIMLGRLQQELREAYGAENARKVMQAMIRSACRAFRWRRGSCFSPPDFGRPFTRWPPSLFQRFLDLPWAVVLRFACRALIIGAALFPRL